jgi:nucleoid-associated protein YgaU
MTMQRDMKIGMALGLLLVGIVGALFFRRDPEPAQTPVPPLKGGAELDRQIAEKSKAPYIKGLDEFKTPATPATKNAPTNPAAKPPAYEVPGFLTKQDASENRAVVTAKQSAAPDPIATPPAPQPPPAHNRDWDPVGAGSPGKNGGSARPAGGGTDPNGRRTHVTQPGETLSGLAANYLGSTTRFRELYDANRNVLRSPDDLPNGVTLVIPDSGKTNATPVSSHTSDSAGGPKVRKTSTQSTSESSVGGVSGDYQPGKLRFAPATGSPFGIGRMNAGDRPGAIPPPGSAPPTGSGRPRLGIDDGTTAPP